ncbi:hypothetical protein [Methanoculleus chikugoensis]|uniref:hypothetical protein n=1 Tax=Methanoculleus chikugoensis TaxID=118126 RepID=UPI000AD881F0|nr:hypothetical protein [Methanoculleus chikugoensis]
MWAKYIVERNPIAVRASVEARLMTLWRWTASMRMTRARYPEGRNTSIGFAGKGLIDFELVREK